MFKTKGGGGQRVFEQCSKKLQIWQKLAPLSELTPRCSHVFLHWSRQLLPPCKYVLCMRFAGAKITISTRVCVCPPLPAPCKSAPLPCKSASAPRAWRDQVPSTFRTCVTLCVKKQHMRDNWLHCWFPPTLLDRFSAVMVENLKSLSGVGKTTSRTRSPSPHRPKWSPHPLQARRVNTRRRWQTLLHWAASGGVGWHTTKPSCAAPFQFQKKTSYFSIFPYFSRSSSSYNSMPNRITGAVGEFVPTQKICTMPYDTLALPFHWSSSQGVYNTHMAWHCYY